MREVPENILSKILKKRVGELGYASLLKFHSDRKELACSYELLRQVVYAGRVPKSETLLRILQAMRFSPAQARKIMELHYRGYVPRDVIAPAPAGTSVEDLSPESRETAGDATPDPAAASSAGEGDRPPA